MTERDIDAEFDAIVARWDHGSPADGDSPAPSDSPGATEREPDVPPVPPSPITVHDITAAYAALSRPMPDEDHVARAEDAAAAEVEAWRAGASIDDDDEHFEPGPVHLPPGEDLGYWGALAGLVGGPLLMLWVALTSPFYRGWWIVGAIGLFVGGFALLVMRQPKDRDPFDGDDGARV